MDATQDNQRLGRLVNHSKTATNVITKVLEIDRCPHLCLLAAKDIQGGEHLQYDYGDRRKEVIELFPWLAT